jgi:hypothetical protein
MTGQTVCINQFMKSEDYIYKEGIGNCSICLPDEKNKFCNSYSPMVVSSKIINYWINEINSKYLHKVYVVHHCKQEENLIMNSIIELMLNSDIDIQTTKDLDYIFLNLCTKKVVPSYTNYKNFCDMIKLSCHKVEKILLGPYRSGY